MAATLDTVTEKIKEAHGENKSRFDQVIAGQDEQIRIQNASLRTLQTMLGVSADALTDAREAAREAARVTGDDGPDVPDAKAEEAKAGGFFSKMGKAIMNPVGAMGKGMKSMGKGIQGFLTGLAKGLAAFANPMVLVGITVLSVSLPIFAAGLAAAFKVFEMIAGEGKALEFVTGVILSLGEAIGTILQKVLEGFGNMVKNMGPFITKFFEGIAKVIKALEPIVVSIFKIIKDIITDPVLNKTIQKLLETIGIAIKEVSVIIQKTGDVIISIMENIGGIIESVGNAISTIFTSIGTSIETVLNAIGDNIQKVGKTIEGIIGKIGETVTSIIDSIVGGIERLAALDAGNMGKVALALAGLAGALVLFGAGAMIAGAVMPSADDFTAIANSVKKFDEIDPTNLVAVGDGMKAVGVGLGFFAMGQILNLLAPENSSGLDRVATSVQKFGKIDATGFAQIGDGIKKLGIGIAFFAGGEGVGAVMDFFTSWAKDKDTDPIEKFKKFAEIGPGLSQAGMGVSALANSFDAFDEEKLQKIGVGLNTFLQSTDMAKLKEFSSATEGLVSGQMLAQLQVQANQAAATGMPLIISNVNSHQTNSSSSAMFPGSKASAQSKEDVLE